MDDACTRGLTNAGSCDAALAAGEQSRRLADAREQVAACQAGARTACDRLDYALHGRVGSQAQFCGHVFVFDPEALAAANPQIERVLALQKCAEIQPSSAQCSRLSTFVADHPDDAEARTALEAGWTRIFTSAARECRALAASTSCLAVSDFVREYSRSRYQAEAQALLQKTEARRAALRKKEDQAAYLDMLRAECPLAKRGALPSSICDGKCAPPFNYARACRQHGLWK